LFTSVTRQLFDTKEKGLPLRQTAAAAPPATRP
jgi:hypothetical protein